MKNNIDYFYQLSQVITGDNGIPQSLKAEYFDRVNAYYEPDLTMLLEKFKTKVVTAKTEELESKFREEIFDKASKSELNLIKQIILLWYTAQFNTTDGRVLPAETEQQYKLQRMYPLIKAPVRAYANHNPKDENAKFTYGYWSQNPNQKK
jgi:hypothetical protein